MTDYAKIIDNLRNEPNYQNLWIYEAADALEAQARRIAELEAAIDEAIEYVAGHDDEWPKALAVRLRAARAALEKTND
jgi:hypothetical protein